MTAYSTSCRALRGQRSAGPPYPWDSPEFDVGAGQGRLHVINDNAGRLFHLSQEPWAARAMVDVGRCQRSGRKACRIGRPPARHTADRDGAVVPCALAAISETDMMLLGVRDYGPGTSRRSPHPARTVGTLFAGVSCCGGPPRSISTFRTMS